MDRWTTAATPIYYPENDGKPMGETDAHIDALIHPALLVLLDVPVDEPQWQALAPFQRRRRILDAIKHLLLRESQVQPLFLVVESFHWIDAETQGVLDSVVESLPAARVLLLVSYRPDYHHGWTSKTYSTQLRLDPLPSLPVQGRKSWWAV
jgi:predicted ATPase